MPAVRNRPASISADFTGVEERRGQRVHVPPGDYIVEVKDYEVKHKKDDETRLYISWRLYIISPEANKGKGPIYYNTSLVPESLWNLRNFLEDMGVKVPKSKVDVPLAKIIGKTLGVTLEDEEYNNVTRSQVASTFNKNDLGATEADEETTTTEEATAAVTSDDDEDMEELDLDGL